jgi:hypothetical protein
VPLEDKACNDTFFLVYLKVQSKLGLKISDKKFNRSEKCQKSVTYFLNDPFA